MFTRPRLLIFLLLCVALPGALLAGCGGNEGEAADPSKDKEQVAFLEAMIPHHEMAVEMAEMAKERGQDKEVKALASDIVSDQNGEIRQIERIYKRLYGEEIKPDPGAHDVLGLSAKDAGMEHAGMDSLARAKPFDRAFIDEMIPHHQGAIRMAHAVVDKASDGEVKQLAEGIIKAQALEINRMNKWRKRWYGQPSPAGGVPKPGEKSSGGDALPPAGHEGH